MSEKKCCRCSTGDCSSCQCAKSNKLCKNCEPGKRGTCQSTTSEKKCCRCSTGDCSSCQCAKSNKLCKNCEPGKRGICQSTTSEKKCCRCSTGDCSSCQCAKSNKLCKNCEPGKRGICQSTTSEKKCCRCSTGDCSSCQCAKSNKLCKNCEPGKRGICQSTMSEKRCCRCRTGDCSSCNCVTKLHRSCDNCEPGRNGTCINTQQPASKDNTTTAVQKQNTKATPKRQTAASPSPQQNASPTPRQNASPTPQQNASMTSPSPEQKPEKRLLLETATPQQKALSKAAIQKPETALQPNLKQKHSIKVMSWNVDHKNGGKAARRDELLVPKVKESNPDVLLLQESKVEKVVQNIKDGMEEKCKVEYKAVGGKTREESRILYNSNKFTIISDEEKLFPQKAEHKTLSLKEILSGSAQNETTSSQTRSGQHGMRNAIDDRMTAVALNLTGTSTIIVFLSFHNIRKGHITSNGKVNARECAEQFRQLMSEEIHEKTGCLVVCGADLNYQLTKDDYTVWRAKGAAVINYTPTERRSAGGKKIDYIIIAPPQGAEGVTVSAVNIFPKACITDDYDKALDHDPLVFELMPQIQEEVDSKELVQKVIKREE